MGKVIKGSPENPQRYTLAIPAFGTPSPAYAPAVPEDVLDDFAIFGTLPPRDEPVLSDAPSEPDIELENIQAQAQALIDDAARSADTLVQEAHERARVIVEEADARAAGIADDARRDAHAEGFAAGSADAHAEMSEALATLRELVEAARGERHALVTGAEPELVRLAVGIAERVLHQQIALDNGVVVEMAKAAIARIIEREKITVRVNPGDMERMREYRDELLALGDVKTMRVIEDQRVDRGGVIIETDSGSVDAKISTQLTEVRKILHIVDDVVVQPLAHPGEATALPSARAS